MLLVVPKDYDSLKDYALACIGTYLQDNEKDITDPTEWELVNKFDRNEDWEDIFKEFMAVFNVTEREELVDVYSHFKYELNERLGTLAHNSNTTAIKDIITGNFMVDLRYGWSYDEHDLLILDDYNQGMVVRFGLIDAVRDIQLDMKQGKFAVPYSA